jgi:hypothetical protein
VRRLAAFSEVAQEPAARGGTRAAAQTQRVREQPALAAHRHDLRREDALGDEQGRVLEVEHLVAGAGAGGDVVRGHVGAAGAAQLLDRRDGGFGVP